MQFDSFRDHYLTSKPLNPEKSQESPLELVNEQIFSQAEIIKNQLKSKSGSRSISRKREHSEDEIKGYSTNITPSKKNSGNYMSKTIASDFASNEHKIRIKKEFRSRKSISSKDNSNLGSLVYEPHMFNKITIHCLKAKREQFERDAVSMEREYKYTVKKLEKIQKMKEMAEAKSQKLTAIKEQKARMQQQIRRNLFSNQLQTMKKKELMKQKVLSHRQHKEQVLEKARQQKLRSGSDQRLISEQLGEYLDEASYLEYQKKKRQYSKQKEDDQKRKALTRKKKESKQLQAKIQFRNKWLVEYERSQEAKQQLTSKRFEFTRKIKNALQHFSSVID